MCLWFWVYVVFLVESVVLFGAFLSATRGERVWVVWLQFNVAIGVTFLSAGALAGIIMLGQYLYKMGC